MLADKTTSLSDTLAQHFATTTFADFSPATLHATRRALLDACGVMLAASGLAEDALAYRRHALNQGAGSSRLLGLRDRVSPAAAALANGALAHALDYGDTFDPGPAHPGAAMVPALLALSDADTSIDRGQLLAAMALGSNLACRLSLAPARTYEEGGWYPPPLVGLIASAAACAKLLGLDAAGIRNAMGLALLQGTFPGEIKYDRTSPLRGVREGFAARGAVEAALLAQAGARAFAEPLEGKAGFFAVYGGGGPREVLLDGLGERYLGEQVSFKPWPCCRGTHPYIESALALRAQIDWRSIKHVEVEIGTVQEMLIRPQAAKAAPESAIEAKFSIPFTLGHAFIHGSVHLDSFDANARGDAQVLALATRVHERRNPEWGFAQAASGSVTLKLKDGNQVVHRVDHARGHPGNPIDDEALVAKFIACAARAATPIAQEDARTMAMDILSIDGSRPTTSLLSGQR